MPTKIYNVNIAKSEEAKIDDKHICLLAYNSIMISYPHGKIKIVKVDEI